ncbi:MAG TPA: hypothetical protein VGD54_18140, partial [Steroidobacteraceae bacterium]
GVVLRALRPFFENRVPLANVPLARMGVLVSWCGMRGLVTLATALALPQPFPGRDVIVLSAFMVVLGTLILQGFTIRPLIALLRIAPDSSLDEEVSRTRKAMLKAAVAELAKISDESAAAIRAEYDAAHAGSVDRSQPDTAYDTTRMRAIAAQRRLLAEWRRGVGSRTTHTTFSRTSWTAPSCMPRPWPAPRWTVEAAIGRSIVATSRRTHLIANLLLPCGKLLTAGLVSKLAYNRGNLRETTECLYVSSQSGPLAY